MIMLLNRIKTRLVEMLRNKLRSIVGLDTFNQEEVNRSNELAAILRQEEVNRSNELAAILRQEEVNRSNELAAILRQEDAQWADILRKEVYPIKNEMGQTGNELATSLMQTRLLYAKEKWKNIQTASQLPSRLKKVEGFQKYLEKFKKLHSHLYEIWGKINFDINIENYKNNQVASCAVSSRLDARIFAGFIAPYLNGRVLDVGCGPNELPYYLEGYPLHLISGIDPLEPFSPHPFEFVQGFAEFLPWEDASFDVVLAATSLDHVIDLDLALSEVVRVLKPGGLFLVWEWFADEAKPYDPINQSPQLVDNFHLFNFDNKWFEDVTSKDFTIIEAMKLFGEYRHYNFHCLKSKKA